MRKKTSSKQTILFVDGRNDLQSQIAEYFANEMFGDRYDFYSAGPKKDCIDCELISVMYQLDYDIRDHKAKDFGDESLPEKFDYVIFLEKETCDSYKDKLPWDAPKILKDFGRKNNFEDATDDLELYECYKALIEKVRAWVADSSGDVEKFGTKVI